MNNKQDEKQKRYNLIKWSFGIGGVVLILATFFIDDNSKTENIVSWTGYGSVWAAVMMKFLDPALKTKHRDTPDKK